MLDIFIEKLFYLSESLLVVVTRSHEIRLLYTQKFEPGSYDAFADFELTQKRFAEEMAREEAQKTVTLSQHLNS